MAWLKSLGCFTEIHQYQLRLFVPMDDPAADDPAADDPVSDENAALRIVTEIVARQA